MSSVCQMCGEVHLTPRGFPACKAHTKRGAFRANPVRGAAVCSKHGMTGAVRAKAAQRVAEAKVSRTLGDLMREHDIPDQHPFQALLDLSRRMGAMTRSLEELVSEYRAEGHDDRLQAALGLYERFGRLHAQVSKTALDANLDERLMRVTEDQVAVLFAATGAAMLAAGLSPPQQDAFRKALAQELDDYRERHAALPRALG